MKEKYSSGTARQGSVSSPQEIRVEYAGFFGSWDSPNYRFFMTFLRVCMAAIFIGLLYVNALMIRDPYLWPLIAEDEYSTLIIAAIDGIGLLTLGLLSIVSYKFYRHMKREDVRLQNRSNQLTAHAQLLLHLFREIKSGLWEQFISIENKLVNSAVITNPNFRDSRYGALNFNRDQNELWCHIVNLERMFGVCYKLDEDMEACALSAKNLISYKPLATHFEQLEAAIKELIESGVDINNERPLLDLVCSRLVEPEGLNRRAIEMIMQTESTLDSMLLPRDCVPPVKFTERVSDYEDGILIKKPSECLVDPFDDEDFTQQSLFEPENQ